MPSLLVPRCNFEGEIWLGLGSSLEYLEQEGRVVYTSKDGNATKVFPAMEWLAAMCSRIPNKGEQMVHYYGYYSNVSRGKRKEAGTDEVQPLILSSILFGVTKI